MINNLNIQGNKTIFVQTQNHMKGVKLFVRPKLVVIEYFLSGIFEHKPAKPDKRDIQPLNKVSVIKA